MVPDARDVDVGSSRSCVALFCCPPRQVDETGTDGEVHRKRRRTPIADRPTPPRTDRATGPHAPAKAVCVCDVCKITIFVGTI